MLDSPSWWQVWTCERVLDHTNYTLLLLLFIEDDYGCCSMHPGKTVCFITEKVRVAMGCDKRTEGKEIEKRDTQHIRLQFHEASLLFFFMVDIIIGKNILSTFKLKSMSRNCSNKQQLGDDSTISHLPYPASL
ncbi:hypothetical protein SCA6_014071 [Theobroma cacao]